MSSGERPSTGTPSSQAEAVGGAADDAQGDPQAQQASEESEQERPGRWAGLLRLLAGRRASAKAGVEGRDPAIAIFEEQAATQALQEAKALLVADVEALVTRFDALKRGVQQASPRARARLERSVRDLGVEVDQVRRKVTSLRVVPSNDGAYRQGSLELRVQWLKERLRQAEAAWRSPRAEVPLAARAASRVSRVPLAR